MLVRVSGQPSLLGFRPLTSDPRVDRSVDLSGALSRVGPPKCSQQVRRVSWIAHVLLARGGLTLHHLEGVLKDTEQCSQTERRVVW